MQFRRDFANVNFRYQMDWPHYQRFPPRNPETLFNYINNYLKSHVNPMVSYILSQLSEVYEVPVSSLKHFDLTKKYYHNMFPILLYNPSVMFTQKHGL
jgi:hypothetical protein